MNPSNEELTAEYLRWLKDTKGRTGVTVYNYTSTLIHFLEWVAPAPLAAVSVEQMEAFVQRPRGKGRHKSVGAPATQAKDVAIVRALYSYLLNRGYANVNRAALLGTPKVHNKNPRPIPDVAWAKLYAEAQGVEAIALGLGFFVGLRRREVCELRPEQVQALSGQLVNFKRKGGGDDVTPYRDLCEILADFGSARFVDELGVYTDHREGRPFLVEWGEQVPSSQRERLVHTLPEGMTDPALFGRRMRSVCERAEVGPFTPHQLRHSFVTNLLRRHVPLHLVQSLANHSSPDVTSRYIKAGSSELREWLDLVNRHE